MSDIFEVKLTSLPNEDLVRGFPGITASWPRIEGTVEIRPKTLSISSLLISSVKVTLFRTDSIHPPSNKTGINAPRKEQSYMVGQEQSIFKVSAGRSYEEVLALDLPFIISLPIQKNLPASISVSKGLTSAIVETTYRLYVSISYGKQLSVHHQSFPIRIKPYHTLTIFGSFHIPVSKTVRSSDHLVTLDYSVNHTALGPGDTIMAVVKVSPNPDWAKSRKVKLVRLTMQIQEVITFSHEGDEPVEKRSKICKVSKQLDMKLPESGHLEELFLEYQPIQENVDKNGLVPKERQDVPNISRYGFTTSSALYQIDYLLVIKARFTHAKDIEVEQPIVACPFDNATSMSFTASISEAVKYANRANRSAVPSSRIYKPTDAMAVEMLNRKVNTYSGKASLSIKVK
ncbi:hypothetical protein AWJ20_2990 [Sugiyamaella lignohabitans]|uniref:Arrestin C-terminal-like domain-containing protein n=1 Tax=Sugiyamaella lignohabitans TaxID=796027 RepID=A0A167FIZ2_9ASCO|nr:uncharacterized protein AWJ20_2990 [Sugiyamaella lignohabitans]ANB15363.1 hypothetical protein AWJ20_2990 [Sugiyamaella lignohabitans]